MGMIGQNDILILFLFLHFYLVTWRISTFWYFTDMFLPQLDTFYIMHYSIFHSISF